MTYLAICLGSFALASGWLVLLDLLEALITIRTIQDPQSQKTLPYFYHPLARDGRLSTCWCLLWCQICTAHGNKGSQGAHESRKRLCWLLHTPLGAGEEECEGGEGGTFTCAPVNTLLSSPSLGGSGMWQLKAHVCWAREKEGRQ